MQHLHDIGHIFIHFVLPFIPVLTIVVFIHEFGHYWVARRNGVAVEVFSIGMGPELFGWTDRSGTRWRVSILPIGGYVKWIGDANIASVSEAKDLNLSPQERARTFHGKTVGQRAAITVAGPVANFILAFVLLSFVFAWFGQPYTLPIVSGVEPNSAADVAGLKDGDKITDIDGTAIHRFQDIIPLVGQSSGKALAITFERDGTSQTLSIVPHAKNSSDAGVPGGYQLGIQSRAVAYEKLGFLNAFGEAVNQIWTMVSGTLVALGQILTGHRGTNEIGGILTMANISGHAVEGGWADALTYIALISANLGFVNLLPIPVLDGGHLMFYAAEGLRGRPLGKRVQEWGSLAGLATVLGLMFLATWNDLNNFHVGAFFAQLFG